MGDPYDCWKFDYKTMQASFDPSSKTNKGQQIKADNVDVIDAKASMLDYFRFSINRAAHKKKQVWY